MPLRRHRVEESVSALDGQQARASTSQAAGLPLAHADGHRPSVGDIGRSFRCCGDSRGTHAKKTATAV